MTSTPYPRPRRSALYLPASNARAIAKARTLPCDVVILDLEDSVAPDAKGEARLLAVEAVAAGGFGRRELVVRCNGLDTPWGPDDIAALRQARPDAVLAPKIDDGDGVAAYAAALGGVPLWAMVETCTAILRIDGLAGAARAHPLHALVMGTNDLAKAMRAPLTPERDPLKPALALAVTAARAHGVAVLDGVFNAIDDLDGLAAQCAQAAAFGFDGKTVIHPSHLDACIRAFTPDAAAIDWARRVIAAYGEPQNATAGAIRLEGRMVERLHLEEARDVLARASAAG